MKWKILFASVILVGVAASAPTVAASTTEDAFVPGSIDVRTSQTGYLFSTGVLYDGDNFPEEDDSGPGADCNPVRENDIGGAIFNDVGTVTLTVTACGILMPGVVTVTGEGCSFTFEAFSNGDSGSATCSFGGSGAVFVGTEVSDTNMPAPGPGFVGYVTIEAS